MGDLGVSQTYSNERYLRPTPKIQLHQTLKLSKKGTSETA